MKGMPPIRHHAGVNQAYVRLPSPRGKARVVYLGTWGSAGVQQAYERAIAEWLGDGKRPATARGGLTVAELADAYLQHARGYYRKAGRPTSQVKVVAAALKGAVAAYGSTPARDFGTKAFQAVRARWVERGLVLKSINDFSKVLRECWRWGAEGGLVPPETALALKVVRNLRAGRGEAVERPPVAPASWEDVEATLPHLPAAVAAMCRLIPACAMRPGEARGMRPADVDRSGKVWEYTVRPEFNKTAHVGRERIVMIPPRVQPLLAGWLDRTPDTEAFVFRPTDYARNVNRRRCGACYSGTSLALAIRVGCRKANVRPWRANELRHLGATEVRRVFGDVEAARVVLGHSDAKTSARYAQRDRAEARRLMEKMV